MVEPTHSLNAYHHDHFLISPVSKDGGGWRERMSDMHELLNYLMTDNYLCSRSFR